MKGERVRETHQHGGLWINEDKNVIISQALFHFHESRGGIRVRYRYMK